jgi:hypothetical protein
MFMLSLFCLVFEIHRYEYRQCDTNPFGLNTPNAFWLYSAIISGKTFDLKQLHIHPSVT